MRLESDLNKKEVIGQFKINVDNDSLFKYKIYQEKDGEASYKPVDACITLRGAKRRIKRIIKQQLKDDIVHIVTVYKDDNNKIVLEDKSERIN